MDKDKTEKLPVSPAELLTTGGRSLAENGMKVPVVDRIDVQNGGNSANTTPGQSSSLKYISLVVLTLQNAVLILVMRYVRIREGDMFMATTAVVMSELLKFLSCLGIIFIQEGFSVMHWLHHLNENIIKQPLDCLKVSVPSVVYTLQNNLLYLALSNLEAATFQVTYQLKILTTALFSVVMLRKEVAKLQWIALVVLFIGISCVQLKPDEKSSKVKTEQKPLIGLVAVIISCLMSGFAGVYFEKILKGTKQSVWLRNVQLGFIGVIFGLIGVEMNDGAAVREKGFFYGYDWVVWFVICLQSFGGLMVAVVIKYADNILKGFATSCAIVLSCVASVYYFDFHISVPFTVGATLVIISVYMYSKFAPKPLPPPLPLKV